jgi:hypothetical protein
VSHCTQTRLLDNLEQSPKLAKLHLSNPHFAHLWELISAMCMEGKEAKDQGLPRLKHGAHPDFPPVLIKDPGP